MGKRNCFKLRSELIDRSRELREKWKRGELDFDDALELYGILYVEEEVALQSDELAIFIMIGLMRTLLGLRIKNLAEQGERNG